MTKPKTVKAWALLYRGKPVYIQNEETFFNDIYAGIDFNDIYAGIDGKIHDCRTLKKVPCTITYKP